VSAAGVAALTDLPVRDARDALECLAQAHLIEVAAPSAERWRVPAVGSSQARLPTGELADEEREQARDRLLDYYLITAEAADRQLRELPHGSEPEEFADQDEALAWLDAERLCLIAVVRMAAGTGSDEAAKSLPLLMAYYLGFCGLFDDLLGVTTTSLLSARRLGDRTAEGEALTNLGLASWGLRRYQDAVIAHRDAAAIFRETGDRQGEGDALNNLGIALHGLGRDGEAVIAHRDAAAIFRETGDRLGDGKALNNLGLALCAQQLFDDAVNAHQGAVIIFREASQRREEASALANLGNDMRKIGRLGEAIDAYQQAIDIFREIRDERSELMAWQGLEMSREAVQPSPLRQP
jgi:tetratricopeptide (TPR) repeat protein